MLLAVWRRAGHSLPEPLASAVSKLFEPPGLVRVDDGGAALGVWSPAHLERLGSSVVAWAVSGDGTHMPPGLPSVRFEADTLTITGPSVPQYPLYYIRGVDDAYVIVSSQLEPLTRLVPNRPLNAQRVVSILAGAVDPDRAATVYAGIRRLLPSETITADCGGIRSERSLPRIGKTYRRGSAADLAFELRGRLDAAIARAVGASKRVAVLVSGGLDSSGLLALIASRCHESPPLDVYAISLQVRTPGDDRPHFATLTRTFPVAPVPLYASDAGHWFRRSLCADGQPGAGPALCLEMLFYATAARLGADVALSGSAGDTVLGGPLPFAQLAQRGHLVAALDGALRIRMPWSMNPWTRIRNLVLRPLLPRYVVGLRRPRHGHAPWMTPTFRTLLDRCRDLARGPDRPLPDTPDDWMEEWCEGDDCVLPTIADGAGQVLAVTHGAAFDPFMDIDFLRFVFELDPVLLSYGHEHRGLYRLAMKGTLPESIRTRQDKGEYEPAFAAAALSANALELFDDLSTFEALTARGLIDPRPLRPIFDRWLGSVRQGERPHHVAGDECWQQIWQLLSVEAFLREHGQRRDFV